MEINRYLAFNSEVGKVKRQTQGSERACPFCNHEGLIGIVAEEGPFVLVKNKYATLAETLQLVLIESDDCAASISTYDTAYMRQLVAFGIKHWLALENSGEFRSVLFYKNHGPLSGGTIGHAHMQIVGLKDLDYRALLEDDRFSGIELCRDKDCSVNLSSKPRASSLEFNILTPPGHNNFLADNIQRIVKYVVEVLSCKSYNLFFYQWNGLLACKIVPRYVTSPFFIGYSISQVSDQLETVAETVRQTVYGSQDHTLL